jgi:hypothetical protein
LPRTQCCPLSVSDVLAPAGSSGSVRRRRFSAVRVHDPTRSALGHKQFVPTSGCDVRNQIES